MPAQPLFPDSDESGLATSTVVYLSADDVPDPGSGGRRPPGSYTTGELPALGLAEPLPPIAIRTILDMAPEVLAELVATARTVARELEGLEPKEVERYRAQHPFLLGALADMLRFVLVINGLPPDRECPVCALEGRPPYPMSWVADDQVYFCPLDSHQEGLQ